MHQGTAPLLVLWQEMQGRADEELDDYMARRRVLWASMGAFSSRHRHHRDYRAKAFLHLALDFVFRDRHDHLDPCPCPGHAPSLFRALSALGQTLLHDLLVFQAAPLLCDQSHDLKTGIH